MTMSRKATAYPATLYAAPALTREEHTIIEEIEKIRDTLQYSLTRSRPPRWIGLLRRNTFARAIQGSNSIEGYNVSAEDAIAAVERHQPLDAERETWAAVTGYRDAMTYVLQLSRDPHFSYNQ